MRFLATLTLCLLLATLPAPLPAHAEACHGRNLISALPPAELAALQARAEVPFAHGNLWKATKDGQQITLAGTYHLNDPRFAPILDTLAPHLAKAAVLLVESGPLEEAALKAKIARDPSLMLMATGHTLPELLSDADWQSLSTALKARGMMPFMAARMQPWLVASMLQIPACMFPLAGNGDQGLDKLLMARAAAQGLPIRALEPADAVLTMFSQFGRAEQLDMLVQTVATDAQSDDMSVTLSDTYFAGESRLFWEFTRDQMLSLPDMTAARADTEMALMEKAMITTRNAAWIAVLQAEAARGPVLAAFGALHLPGEAGVLNLLAQNGWTVTRITP